MARVNTLQSNIKKYDSDFIKNYSIFLGGLNATHQSLQQYDPLKTGYSRIFFLKMPTFMETIMPDETKRIRHLMEYGFTRIDGLGNTTLDTEQITGGYTGRSFEVGTVARDETANITISLYEFSGSPVREYLDMWISGISDPYTGLGHYHGAMELDSTIKYSQHNHVAEAIYVTTDPTGKEVEYCCLLTNMFPKSSKADQFNYESGQHAIVQTDIEFSVVKYQSPQINTIGKALIDKFQVMTDYLDFESEYSKADVTDKPKYRMLNWADKYNKNLTED